ncbi:complement C3-like [Penaeus chinensis]|uniref:complement C3-like n=1 Tax=Penaeus chinensis TaxID=139456 RepID=UPI001FB7448E|nr:complement C3-like [Penaeus chinensis]
MCQQITVQFRVVLLRRDLTPYDGPVDVFVLKSRQRDTCHGAPTFVRNPTLHVTEYGTQSPVIVEMPFYTSVSEKAVRGRFLALFKTYMPVSGNATVTLYKKSPVSMPDSSFTEVTRKDVHIVNGWHNFSFSADLLMDETITDLRQVEVMVKVNVHNIFEGSTMTGHARTRFVSDDVRLEFVGADPLVFKPGMPLSGVSLSLLISVLQITVKHEDSAPLEEEKLQESHLVVRASVTLSNGATEELPEIVVRPKDSAASSPAHLLRRYAYGNASESVHLPQLDDVFHLTSTANFRKTGMLRFTIYTPEEATSLRLSAVYKDDQSTASTKAQAVRPHSRTGRYIHVTSSTTTARVGDFAIVHVRANFRMEKFQYLVMSKSVMVYSATEEFTVIGTDVVWTVSLTVSREMCPRFTVVVIHVTQDGELVTDSAHIAVGFQSMKASLTLNQRKDHSKRTVEAAMTAPPGAILSASCLRRESSVLRPSSRVGLSRILRAALAMEPHPRSIHHAHFRSRNGLGADHLETLSTENTATFKLSSLHFSGLSLAMDAALDSPAGTDCAVISHCDSQLGFLECGDGSCYHQLEVCDGREQCQDGADEASCLTIETRLQEDDSSGHKEFQRAELIVPNALGDWIFEAFVVHPHFGLSVLPARPYDSTPPLFVSLEATPVCRRGEQISVKVHLHNARPRRMSVLVVLEGSDHHRFVHVEEGGHVNHFSPRLSAGDHQHLVWVEGGGWTQVMFPLAVLKQAGKVTVTIKALSSVGSDVRSITVKVEPEGASVRKHTSVLLDLKSRATVYEFLDLPVDKSPVISKSIFRRYVYGSPKAKVTLSGDVFGPTSKDMTLSFKTAFKGRILKSTDGLAFNFGSTVWTLHYLRLTNQLNMTKAKKAFEFLNSQLAGLFARYSDGAFRMWKASEPSVWMTTWVLSVLLPAQLEDWENLVYIEPRLINTVVSFILEHQLEDGSFREPFTNVTLDHKMSSKRMMWKGDAKSSSVPLTALVTTVLYEASPSLDSGIRSRAFTAREKAIRYLEQNLESVWEPYELAITAYALTLVNSPSKEVAAKMLERQARVAEDQCARSTNATNRGPICIKTQGSCINAMQEKMIFLKVVLMLQKGNNCMLMLILMAGGHNMSEDGKIHWSKKAIESNARRAENSQHSFLLPKEPQEWDSYAVEATSYALMVFLMREGVTERQEAIVEWLTSVRDWNRAFSSSVDTVVALRALAEYSYRARLREVTALRVRMTATSFPDAKTNISIGKDALSLMRSVPIARPWGHVNLVAEGAGQAVAQLEVSWGVDLDRYLKRPARKVLRAAGHRSVSQLQEQDLDHHDGLREVGDPDESCELRMSEWRVWLAEDVSSTSHAAMLEIDTASGYVIPQPNANEAVKRNRNKFPQLVNSHAMPDRTFWQFQFVPSNQRQCFSFTVRRRFPVANLTAIRSATVFELFAPEHFETVVINVTSLAALDVCEVCGSYQCPYCPHYSGRACRLATMPLVVLLAFSVALVLREVPILFKELKYISSVLSKVWDSHPYELNIP